MELSGYGSVAGQLMAEFADRTGLASTDVPPRRYLWTDAFAVCNFLELFRQTGDRGYRDLALRLVEQGHEILARHRDDAPKIGWISGLDQEQGRQHPTVGGLRIGKELNERDPDEPFDERLEWERDGQYYHYLTKWMHALNCVSRVTKDQTYNRWAVELAKTAHARFTYAPTTGGGKRMFWKMSIDLSRPLVPSMGQHDPLDGLITYSQLQAAAKSTSLDLAVEIADMAAICRGKNWATDDPLGIGGLLADAGRMAQLAARGEFEELKLLEAVLDCALVGLESLAQDSSLSLPADYRLAFRELGLSIGLKAVEKLQGESEALPGLFGREGLLRERVEALMSYAPLGEMIERFWTDDRSRQTATWAEHRDINMVMLATSLTPDGFLTI